MPKKLSHYDRDGRARMVDVSGQSSTKREAEASGFVAVGPKVLASLPSNPKGDPLEVARIAGIMAAKRTSELIPMCHPLPLSFVDVDCARVREWPRHHLQSRDDCRDRSRDGGNDGSQRSRSDDL